VVRAEARKWSTTPKCIDKRSQNWLDWKVHYTENPSMRFMFVTFQYYCICWMSKLPRLKIKHHQNYDGSVWMCFCDRIQRQDQENLSYLMLSIIIEKEDFEINRFYKTIWDLYPGIG
jgi:hypothetical protein